MHLPIGIDGPVAVIGDVHGQHQKLESLLENLSLRADFNHRWIVFMGDLIDRGPNPRLVIEKVIDLLQQHPRTTVIAGNHEWALCSAMDWPAGATKISIADWLEHYETQSTFLSYGARPGELDKLRERIPETHKQFFNALPWFVSHPNYLFVHAGLHPRMPMQQQLQMMTVRQSKSHHPFWLCSKRTVFEALPIDLDQTVVSGHVPVSSVRFERQRILCDTVGNGAGELSAVLLPEKIVIESTGRTRSGSWRSWWRHTPGVRQTATST